MAKKFRRNHNIRLIKSSETYTVDEACKRLNVGKQAFYSWIKQGLQTLEGTYPKLVHGSAIIAFLQKQRESRKIKCQPDEFCCFKCKAARKPLADSITKKPKGKKLINLSGICSVCGCEMFKAISAKNTS